MRQLLARMEVLSGRTWTAEDDAILRQMSQAGATRRDIAKRLSRTVESIRKRAGILGLNAGAPAAKPLNLTEQPTIAPRVPLDPIAESVGRVIATTGPRTAFELVADLGWRIDRVHAALLRGDWFYCEGGRWRLTNHAFTLLRG